MTPVPSRPGVRRLGVLLALCLVVDAVAPSPALAWFGWLDKWSGPGPFWGLMYDVRVVCFGEQSGVAQVEAAYAQAQQATRAAIAVGSAPNASDFAPLYAEWLGTLLNLRSLQERWHSDPRDRDPVEALLAELKGLAARAPGVEGKPVPMSADEIRTFVEHADRDIPAAVSAVAGQVITSGATGVLWSTCSDQRERRFSLELNVDDWRGFKNDNNRNFSGGTSIRLITAMPSVTWSVIPDKGKDFLDLGFAAGYYAFTSEGFETARGFVLEPLRIDIHAPSSWASYPRHHVRRLASLFTYRFGLMTIPEGFSSDAFAPGSHTGPIPREWVPVHRVFFNLTSLISNPKKKNLPPTFLPQ